MSNAKPRIAVMIASYNAERTVDKSIASLNLNAEPHDIVVIDDGSHIPVESVIPPQPNLVILRSDKNQGLPKTRNMGLNYIFSKHYDYVAILDADDIATADRLMLQRKFLDENPDAGLVGSWARIVSEEGKPLYYLDLPVGHEEIAKGLFYNNCFIHSSLMLRAETFRKTGLYHEGKYPTCEDYYLIYAFARHSRLANLPHYLVDYTISSQGVTQTRKFDQMKCRLQVQWHFRDPLNMDFYIGIFKTIAQMALFPYTSWRHRRQHAAKIEFVGAPPTLVWHPFKGQIPKRKPEK